MAVHPHPRLASLTGIYAIVNESPHVLDLTRAVLRGGVRIVQYRAKGGFHDRHARTLRAMTAEYGALFILNDVWREVERFDADGAHVGPGDAALSELPALRARLDGRILGVSCGDPREARAAQRAGADYLGVGCIYPTTSKSDAGEPIGTEGLRAVARAAHRPIAAIGGITADRLEDVRACGAAMAAIVSAISEAPDPQLASARLIAAWNEPR